MPGPLGTDRAQPRLCHPYNDFKVKKVKGGRTVADILKYIVLRDLGIKIGLRGVFANV